MTNEREMDAPVTRRELREELANYPTKSDLREELANYPTKSDLREALANYPTKSDLREALANHPTRTEMHGGFAMIIDTLVARMDAGFARVDAAFARMREETLAIVKTSETAMILRMEALLDPHRSVPERVATLESEDLPARVTKLERKVFAPKRRTTKRSRTRQG